MINLEKALANQRLLIVDDLVESRSSLKKMAAILGAGQIDVAHDGQEAMQMIREHDYDIVLSDYNLGRTKDGQQVLEEARFTKRLRATSIFVVVTGENALEMVMGALEYEPDGYITKPFTLNMLKERLIRIISIKEELRPINHSIDLGEVDKAISVCLKFLVTKPHFKLPISRILGQQLIRKRNFEAALRIYTELLEERSVSWAKLGQAICFHKLGDSQKAIQQLKATLDEHPLYVQCYDWIAKIELQLEHRKEAQTALEKAVEISPRAVLRQMELGRVAYQNEDYPVAEKAFKNSVILGRYSCHRSMQNYLQFARSVLSNIEAGNGGKVKAKADGAFRALKELKKDYNNQHDSLFEASIIETKTHSTLKNDKEALESTKQAAAHLSKIKDPKTEYKLQMTEAFLDTKQNDKAKEMITDIKKSGVELSAEHKLQMQAMFDAVNKAQGQAAKSSADGIGEGQADILNDEGVQWYERGELDKAIKAFDQATQFKQAGISLLLNSIQAKTSYMEQKEPNKKQLKDCQQLLIRIGQLSKDDERYPRYVRLRKTYDRLCRIVA